MSSSSDKHHGAPGQKTWNSPEAIARHRSMTPEQRIKKTVALSRQAIKMARARRLDGP